MKRSKWMLTVGVCIAMAVSSLCVGCGKDSTPKSKIKLDSGKLESDSVVMAVGDEPVLYSEMMNYAYLLKRQYEGSFGSELWQYPVEDGKTVGSQAKQEIINMVTQLKVIAVTAKDQKVSLTNDEKDEAMQKAESLLSGVSDEDKKTYYLTVQGLSQIYEENILANKMFYVATDDADTDISDEEARQVSIQYMQILTNGTNKDGQTVTLDDTQKAEAKKRADNLQKQAAQTKDFLTLARDNSDAAKQELVVGKDSTDVEQVVVTAALSLKKGEISSVVTGDQGYYIIYCVNDNDEDAMQSRKEEIIAARQTGMFKKKYNSWLKKNEVNISEDFWNSFSL